MSQSLPLFDTCDVETRKDIEVAFSSYNVFSFPKQREQCLISEAEKVYRGVIAIPSDFDISLILHDFFLTDAFIIIILICSRVQ